MGELINIQMNNYTVYMHIAPNGKKYIGITQQKVERRWQNGFAYKKNKHFYNAIQKYSWVNFEHVILFENMSEYEAKNYEIRLIDFYKTADRNYGYNNSIGGESSNGKNVSVESRKRMSEAHKGHKLSEEQKRKIGEAGKGRKLSQSHIAIISKVHKGKIVSEETKKLISNNTKLGMTEEIRKKISEAKKGKKLSQDARDKMSLARKGKPLKLQDIICTNIKTNEQHYFRSVIEAIEWLKEHGYPKAVNSSLYKNFNGERKSAYGFRWNKNNQTTLSQPDSVFIS